MVKFIYFYLFQLTVQRALETYPEKIQANCVSGTEF